MTQPQRIYLSQCSFNMFFAIPKPTDVLILCVFILFHSNQVLGGDIPLTICGVFSSYSSFYMATQQALRDIHKHEFLPGYNLTMQPFIIDGWVCILLLVYSSKFMITRAVVIGFSIFRIGSDFLEEF